MPLKSKGSRPQVLAERLRILEKAEVIYRIYTPERTISRKFSQRDRFPEPSGKY